jgi:hypothetical protein
MHHHYHHYHHQATTLSIHQRRIILNLAAALLWADFRPSLRHLRRTARELDLEGDPLVDDLFEMPPLPEESDPTSLGAAGYRTAHALLQRLAVARPSHAVHEFLMLFEALRAAPSRAHAHAHPSRALHDPRDNHTRPIRYTSKRMHSHGSDHAFETAAA